MHKERFSVLFFVEGSVEVLLPPTASESEIDKAAMKEIWKQFARARGCPFEIQIGRYDGPY